MRETFDGACHCGDVRFRAELDLNDCLVCDCSICTKKGSIVVRVADDDFTLITSLDRMSVYTFNKHIARHYFCPRCGVHPFHRPRSYPELWGVNARCLQGVDIKALAPRQVFGSELD